MSSRRKKFCTSLNHIENFIVVASLATGSISISASLLGIPIKITSSAIGLNN